jgi:hypothetical protein
VFAVNGTDPITLLRYLDVFWRNVFTIFLAVTLVFAIFSSPSPAALRRRGDGRCSTNTFT